MQSGKRVPDTNLFFIESLIDGNKSLLLNEKFFQRVVSQMCYEASYLDDEGQLRVACCLTALQNPIFIEKYPLKTNQMMILQQVMIRAPEISSLERLLSGKMADSIIEDLKRPPPDLKKSKYFIGS